MTLAAETSDAPSVAERQATRLHSRLGGQRRWTARLHAVAADRQTDTHTDTHTDDDHNAFAR